MIKYRVGSQYISKLTQPTIGKLSTAQSNDFVVDLNAYDMPRDNSGVENSTKYKYGTVADFRGIETGIYGDSVIIAIGMKLNNNSRLTAIRYIDYQRVADVYNKTSTVYRKNFPPGTNGNWDGVDIEFRAPLGQSITGVHTRTWDFVNAIRFKYANITDQDDIGTWSEWRGNQSGWEWVFDYSPSPGQGVQKKTSYWVLYNVPKFTRRWS